MSSLDYFFLQMFLSSGLKGKHILKKKPNFSRLASNVWQTQIEVQSPEFKVRNIYCINFLFAYFFQANKEHNEQLAQQLQADLERIALGMYLDQRKKIYNNYYFFITIAISITSSSGKEKGSFCRLVYYDQFEYFEVEQSLL